MPEESGKENNHKKGLAGPNSVYPRVIKLNKTMFFKHGYLFHGLQEDGANIAIFSPSSISSNMYVKQHGFY